MQRASIVLFDLLAAVNERNARLAEMHEAGASRAKIDAAIEESPLVRVNRILRDAGLAVQLRLTKDGTFSAVNDARAAEYPIFKMSDGEKSALLLAAEVLTGSLGSIQIIDEPERHLHRAISASLVEAVVASRPDCHFVVLTHDLDLAASLQPTKTRLLVLTECTWSGDAVVGWDLHRVQEQKGVPEVARRAILGGRRRLLFVEGEPASLDARLYKTLFPAWMPVATGGCDQVIRAVTGMRASSEHHWVAPSGVVDGDGRSEGDRAALLEKGVLALPVNEVESLYYAEPVMAGLAAKQGAALEKHSDELLMAAKTAAIKSLSDAGTPERLASWVANQVLHRKVTASLPAASHLEAAGASISLTVPSPYPETVAEIRTLIASEDLAGLLRLVPVRNSSLKTEVSKALGFRSAADYEAAARVLLRDDVTVREAVIGIIGALPD